MPLPSSSCSRPPCSSRRFVGSRSSTWHGELAGMANLITIGRLLLVFIVIALVYEGGVTTITFCIPVVALIFAADGLDGYVARKRKSTSQFGSIFDIAGDRIVENALWIAFANLGLITVAAPLLVMTRGFVVDGIRSVSYSEGKT